MRSRTAYYQVAPRAVLPALRTCLVALALVALRPVCVGAQSANPERSLGSQAELVPRPAAADILRTSIVPPGFQIDLVATDPDVQQPIAMAWDSRGRLWIAENYTYADRVVKHDLSRFDRILIFEDSDGDGTFDRRRVFWDQAQRLTSIEIGMGGVWAMCPPNLVFLPDRDGDDHPDSAPLVVLDGWEAEQSRHNFANGLRWGPDGWLYGRSGILSTSHVGLPGTDRPQRTAINCGIWRFHPQRHRFEVVCHGTTNPWGMDWDDHGQLFFINTVIGHLWHVLPNAHYQRMYGEDFNPHLYELIGQTADHVHWDADHEDWTAQRTAVSGPTDAAGGGHAHSGLMIYLGDQWPSEFRNELFTINLHGRRINHDHLQRAKATYVGQHRPDFAIIADPWFRGIELSYGPDGGVYLLDWSDIGECHEDDGVHRTSGRIYRIRYRPNDQPAPAAATNRRPLDLATASDDDLVQLQLHANDWFVRQSRRILAERAAAGRDLSVAAERLAHILSEHPDVTRRLRALWCLYGIERIEPAQLMKLWIDPDEHVRCWGVQLACDAFVEDPQLVESLADLARREHSGLVLCTLAATLGKLSMHDRAVVGQALAEHSELANDPVFPLMVWYGIEPVVGSQPDLALQLLETSRIAGLTQFIARRITHNIDADQQTMTQLVSRLASPREPEFRAAIVDGIAGALDGRSRIAAPTNWTSVSESIERGADSSLRDTLRSISVVFGDGRAVEELKALVLDSARPITVRRQAIRSLADAETEDLAQLLEPIVSDRDLGAAAVNALAVRGAPAVADMLLGRYSKLPEDARYSLLEALATRPTSARQLLAAVAAGQVPRQALPAFLLRQLQLLDDPQLNVQILELWPQQRLIPHDKLERIRQLQLSLSTEQLQHARLVEGRQLFEKSCGQCHQLFGHGQRVGPDLTGAQRQQLSYWLENIVDPSATVAMNYRLSIVHLIDGRTLNGVIVRQTDPTITLQTPTEQRVVERRQLEEITASELSLMPEGLLDPLTADQIRDLIGYLMASEDVAGEEK